MTRIDMHTHVLPERYAAQMGAAGLPLPPLSALLEDHDRWRIDGAVLSLGGPVQGDGPVASLCRLINEGFAAIVRDHPDRFGAIACLPLPDVDAALAELEYALDTLELDGVLLLSNYDGVYLGDERLDPLFQELQRRGVYAFVHPDFPPPWPLAAHPGRWYEFPFDTTRAMVNMALAGAFGRFPDVRLQWAHLGGTTPFLWRRIVGQLRRGDPDRAAAMHAAFARQYYDTGLSDIAANLAAATDLAGVEHIVFGTDWPWFVRPEQGDDVQPALAAYGADRARVDAGNAAALVPRLHRRLTGRDGGA